MTKYDCAKSSLQKGGFHNLANKITYIFYTKSYTHLQNKFNSSLKMDIIVLLIQLFELFLTNWLRLMTLLSVKIK